MPDWFTALIAITAVILVWLLCMLVVWLFIYASAKGRDRAETEPDEHGNPPVHPH